MEGYRFITKNKNLPKKKPAHRAPDYIYESTNISDLLLDKKESLEKTTSEILSLLREMENIEEDSQYTKKLEEEK